MLLQEEYKQRVRAMRFGTSTSTNKDAYNKKIDEAYDHSMTNFSAEHANTTSTTDTLKSTNTQQARTISQQQQQLVMTQQQIAANVHVVLPLTHIPHPTMTTTIIQTITADEWDRSTEERRRRRKYRTAGLDLKLAVTA